MASGAQPCSNQRGGSRKSRRHGGGPCSPNSENYHNDQCVVCGDRACSHHYYGVAACHGCKCFFWRSVKTNAQYTCRFGGNCAIDVNGRNTCRKCRFDRCLKAGMKPEAVRMEKLPVSPKLKSSNGQKDLDCKNITTLSIETCPRCKSVESPKTPSPENEELINHLVEIDRIVNVGISTPSNAPPAQSLREAIAEPFRLDSDRAPMSFEPELPVIQGNQRRMLVDAIYWIELITGLGIQLDIDEKMVLLRNCFTSMAVYELCILAAQISADSTKLDLPQEYALYASCKLLACCFWNSSPIEGEFMSLLKPTSQLQLDEKEIALIKAIIILNSELEGLSTLTAQSVAAVLDRVHDSLYQHCTEHYLNSNAPIRFAKLLHLTSRITTLGTRLQQLIQLNHAFCPQQPQDPLIQELLGDICDDHAAPLSCLSGTSTDGSEGRNSTSPVFFDKYDSS